MLVLLLHNSIVCWFFDWTTKQLWQKTVKRIAMLFTCKSSYINKNSIRKTKTEKIKENKVTREYEKTNIVHIQHFRQVFGQNTLANSMSSQRSEWLECLKAWQTFASISLHSLASGNYSKYTYNRQNSKGTVYPFVRHLSKPRVFGERSGSKTLGLRRCLFERETLIVAWR